MTVFKPAGAWLHGLLQIPTSQRCRHAVHRRSRASWQPWSVPTWTPPPSRVWASTRTASQPSTSRSSGCSSSLQQQQKQTADSMKGQQLQQLPFPASAHVAAAGCFQQPPSPSIIHPYHPADHACADIHCSTPCLRCCLGIKRCSVAEAEHLPHCPYHQPSHNMPHDHVPS